MKQPDVSVVIPCYNSEKSIGEVVEKVSAKLSEMGYTSSCPEILFCERN